MVEQWNNGSSQICKGPKDHSYRKSGRPKDPPPHDDYLHNNDRNEELDRLAQTDLWREAISQLPLPDPIPDRDSVWLSSVQNIPIPQSTRVPSRPTGLLANSSPTSHRDLKAASTLRVLPLIDFGPEPAELSVDLPQTQNHISSCTLTETPTLQSVDKRDPGAVENNLLHLNAPWLSSAIKDDVADPDPELNIRFPPLDAQYERHWNIKGDGDEPDWPKNLQVSALFSNILSSLQPDWDYQDKEYPPPNQDEAVDLATDWQIPVQPDRISTVYNLEEEELDELLRDVMQDHNLNDMVSSKVCSTADVGSDRLGD